MPLLLIAVSISGLLLVDRGNGSASLHATVGRLSSSRLIP